MGKARIISQIEPGRYKLELDHGTLKRDDRIAEIDFLLQGEQLALLEATATIIELQNQLNAKVAALNLLINEMNNPPDPNSGPEGEEEGEEEVEEVLDISERVNAAVVEVEQARRTLDRAERQKSDLIMKGAELRLRKANLEKLETDAAIEAWCTDGEPDMSGEVGTVEVPGEPLMPILIKPGFDGGAVYDQARDGQMIERLLMSGAQAYINAALLPGWQRWKPTYRFGAITAIDRDEDTCSIQLEPTRSSAQNLSINPSGMIHGVKAKYQDCDMDVFEEGDEVLVEMQSQSWTEPLVIGFKSDPRPCALQWYWLRYSMDYVYGTTTCRYVKPPDMDEEKALNVPLMTTPYGNKMSIFNREFWGWASYIDYEDGESFAQFGTPGRVLIEVDEVLEYAVAATKNYIWATYMEFSSEDDLGTNVYVQFAPDGTKVRELKRANSSGVRLYDCTSACGLSTAAMFSYENSVVGYRVDVIIQDDGSINVRHNQNDYDVPSGGHGHGDQRAECHLYQIRLYHGFEVTPTAVLQFEELVNGCAIQDNYLAVSLRQSGRLVCYDRKTMAPISTARAEGLRGGMVTVDAARMPTAS